MKKVIYTCIVGGCDRLTQPNVLRADFDYICFVDKLKANTTHVGVWKLKEIPYCSDDDRTLSRFPKLLPHIVLKEYDYSLWIDGNVSINSLKLYDVLDKKIEDNIIYSGIKHWGRNCAYEECVGCVNTCKEPLYSVLKTIFFLKSKKFPHDLGLYENNVIFRKHNDRLVVKFSEEWWQLFLKLAKRDQLCHPYCYHNAGLKFDYLLPENACARNHPYFTYRKHVNMHVTRQGLRKIKYDIRRKINVICVKITIKICSLLCN